MNYNKVFLFFALLLPLLLLGQQTKIIVGGDYDYPPYSFIDENGVATGYDVDVIKAIAEIIDIQVEFEFEHWDTVLRRLERGDIDVIASIVYSENREKSFDFTFPLHTEYYSIFAKKSAIINDVHDLKSKRPAFLKGDFSNESFLIPMGLLNDSLPVKSLPEAIHFVNIGKCDYVIAPYPLGLQIIEEKDFDDIEVKGPPIVPSVYCLAVKEGNSTLLAQLNKGVELLSRNGELERIYKKWVKYQRNDDKYRVFFNYAIVGAGVLVVIAFFLLFYWYSLRLQVAKKTAQVKKAEAFYQKIFNSVDDALLILNNKGVITDANSKALELYDVTHSNMVGLEYLNLLSHENKDLLKSILDNINAEIFPFEGEVKKAVKGVTKFLKVRGVKVLLDKEERYLAVLRDVTVEKNSFTRLQEAKHLAEEANNTKTSFLSTISHEIRTPLNAIIGYSNLLQKTPLHEKQADFNQKIILSSELLLNLVNEILDLTKMDARKLDLIHEPFNLHHLVKKVYEVQKQKANEQGLEFLVEVDNELPSMLLGDEVRLTQILLNVLNNAIKFTHKGLVKLKVNTENVIPLNNGSKSVRVLFSIKDTGIGMTPDYQAKLFRPFEQGQNTNKRKYGGSGLGLAISKQLIDLMGGDISVESNIGLGSVFNICIPFERIAEEPASIITVNKNSYDTAVLNNLTVLLVEDNPFNAEILISQLSEYKIKVSHAESGAEAIQLLNKNSYSIILMDIEMPDMDGFETTQKIKQLAIEPIPIVAISAHSLDSEKQKALQMGMESYLSKPVKIDVLIEAILKFTNGNNTVKPLEVKVLNTERGLDFFGNNKAMYLRGLLRFKATYKSIPFELENQFEINKNSLKIVFHNIKSGAEMIGAEGLHVDAVRLEQMLREHPDKFTRNEVQAFINSLNDVFNAINLYE